MSLVNELDFNTEEFHFFNHRYLNSFVDKIYASRISDERLLTDILDIPCVHHTAGLAGDIKDEKYFDWSNHEYLLQAFKDEFKVHVSRIYRKNVMDISFVNPANAGVKLDFEQYIWVNRQKATEYNPLHNHTGLLSFVYYPDIPDEIREEYKQQTNNYEARGLIEFVASRETDSMVFNPRRGELFMFDAGHRHQVYPFYSDATRVSLAGNIYGILFDDASILGKFV